MQVIITYDLSDGQSEVKNEMVKKGYHSAWVANSITYYLPSTSLWKQDTELATAKRDLEETIQVLNNTAKFSTKYIRLLRCIVLPASPWDGIPGEPHKVLI